MDLSTLSDTFKNWLDSILHSDWLSTLITMVIILIVTAICAHIVTVFLRKLFKMNRSLPAVSIFINIGRVTIWVIGGCVVLSSCFNVNVGAAVTALGIGGIAISLGFQSTLSNLIGGLQIIMTKLIEPGDRIKVGDNQGMVTDVTWRHTTINTARGEKVIIPNSLINTSALVKLAPEDDIRVDIIITPGEESLDDIVTEMQDEVNEAVGKIAVMKEPAQIEVTGKVERGYQAMLTFATGKGTKRSAAIDTAMKAISTSAKRDKSHKKKATVKDAINEQQEAIKEGRDHAIDKMEDELHKLTHHGEAKNAPHKDAQSSHSQAKRKDGSQGDASQGDSKREADGKSGK